MPLHILMCYCKILSVELPWKLICCFKPRPWWSHLYCLDRKESEGLCSTPRLYTDCLRDWASVKISMFQMYILLYCEFFFLPCLSLKFVNVYTMTKLTRMIHRMFSLGVIDWQSSFLCTIEVLFIKIFAKALQAQQLQCML
jgi:hypothetical protein